MKRLILGLCLALLALPATAQQLNIAVAPAHSTAMEAGHVFKTTAGHLYHLVVSNGVGTAGFAMVLDAAAVPGAGTIAPVLCQAIPASGSVTWDYMPTPSAQFTTGIVAVISSGANCVTYTTGTLTAWFDAIYQ